MRAKDRGAIEALSTIVRSSPPGPGEGHGRLESGPPEVADDAARVPVVPGYEIEGELGRGAMGVVFQAVHTALKRRVALKMLLASHAHTDERQRFMSEAGAVAQLKHPNIVQIYEIGEAEGRPFFSLELVEGGSLEERFGGKPMAWRQAAELIALLSRAVHAAHEQGIVHRDLKPANILLEPDGTPKITDFGIAKRLDSKQTQAGKILGTPCYMSPEQALGKNESIGPATDTYALGALLYDALTGRPPFDADNTIDTILQAVKREPVPPRTLQPSVPRDLNVICLKCLEKKPERRYASALELARDLERLLKNEPISARPIGRLERAQRWAIRKPAWATLILALVLGVVGLFAVGAWFTRQLQRELRATEAARLEATRARNELRSKLVQSTAAAIDADLRQLASVPRVLAEGLKQHDGWSDAQLNEWLRAELKREPQIFGMAVAFEPGQFRREVRDYSLYVYRDAQGIQSKQLLPPDYTPIYREWDWYKGAEADGTWSEPYVDEGGGNIPMVTFTMPFERQGKRAGVVTADLSLEYFNALQKAIQASRVSKSSYAMVATSKGTLMSHPDAELRFPGPKSRSHLQSDTRQTSLWARILGGELGQSRGADPLTGKPAELLFAPIRSAHWSCVAIIPD
jgi:tRNA A-37 threonylcarbamoyl transferase component Bud32